MKNVVFFMVLLASVLGRTQDLSQLAVSFIYQLDSVPNQGYNYFLGDSFKEKVKKEDMVKMWGQIETMFGDFESASYICSNSVSTSNQVYISVSFKRKSQNLNIVFNAKNKIEGFFMATTIPCEPIVYPLPKYVKEKRFIEEAIIFKSDGLIMKGAIVLPKKLKKETPVFIFVHGSGPNDRDESVGPNKIFKDLAYGLATKGIPSLRYDKRSYLYKSLELNDDINKEVLNDVTSAIKWVKSQDAVKDRPVYIIGHSIGAYLAPQIANTNSEVNGIIMMAGNCRPLEELIKEQYVYLSNLNDNNSTELRDEITDLEIKMKYLKDSLTEFSSSEKLPLKLPASYWVSLKKYDHKKAIQNLSIPIFVMQGERDYQVTMTDYELWSEVMKGKLNYYSKRYPKLNHLFLEGEGTPDPSEYMIQSHVPKYVIKDIVKWVNKVAK